MKFDLFKLVTTEGKTRKELVGVVDEDELLLIEIPSDKDIFRHNGLTHVVVRNNDDLNWLCVNSDEIKEVVEQMSYSEEA